MKYSRVRLESIGYELAPVVVTSRELEQRLEPMYDRLRVPMGQLEAWTGIQERRWWEPGFPVSDGAAHAAKKALAQAGMKAKDVEAVIFAGVCRDQFEPATACRVAALLGISDNSSIFDLSNACLGVLNGIVDVANRIELGQIRAGLVVSCESAREINDIMIGQMLGRPTMEMFKTSVATLTGGSGAVAVLLTDGSFSREPAPRLVGGANQAAPQFHSLCRWGIERLERIERGLPPILQQTMVTDSIAVLKYGVELGMKTFQTFLARVGWGVEHVDKVICHQVGASHRDTVLKTLGIAKEKDYCTFPFLGNMGTVSLPLTAGYAAERYTGAAL